MVMVRVRTQKVRASGLRGLAIALPPGWAQDVGLKAGSEIDVYRDTEDRLIVAARKASR